MNFQLCSLRVEKIEKLDDFINIKISPFDKDVFQENCNKPICRYSSFGIVILNHYGIFMNTEDFIIYLVRLIEVSKKELQRLYKEDFSHERSETIRKHKYLIKRNTEFMNKLETILYD